MSKYSSQRCQPISLEDNHYHSNQLLPTEHGVNVLSLSSFTLTQNTLCFLMAIRQELLASWDTKSFCL